MRWAGAVVGAVLAALAGAAVPAEPSADELVARLGADDYRTREAAQRALWARGRAAVPALERAVRGPDPEAARRAREVLDRFGWGIYPDTPPAVLDLIRTFRHGHADPSRNDDIRRAALHDLVKLGRPGLDAVGAILSRDIPPEARGPLVANVTALVRREVPLLLFAGKTAEADALMALHAAGTSPAGAADFTAYRVLCGDLPAATAAARARFDAGRKPDSARLLLVHLYRAGGQWAKARDVAAPLPTAEDEASLKEILLEDEGDWAALADLAPGREFNHPEAVRLSLLRLAGRAAKFEEAAKKLRSDADELTEQQDVFDAAVALFANHRADAATELLLEKRQHLAVLSEVLIARMRYKDALELIGARDKDKVPNEQRVEFDLRRARVLMATGYRDDAVQLFEQVARGLRAADRARAGGYLFGATARALVRTELRLGLRDLACEHAAQFVGANAEVPEAGTQGESPFELLFPDVPAAAETLFAVLRAKGVPGPQAGKTLARVRDLLAGTADRAAVDGAAKLLTESAAALPDFGAAPNISDGTSSTIRFEPSGRALKARRFLALALVCRAAKRPADTEAAFERAAALTEGAGGDASGARSWVYGAPDPARVWIEWGEFRAAEGRHRDAAAAFEAGWKRFPDQPLPLFLSGRALVRAGDAKEGARRTELAHWVGLGNEKVRGRFLDELVRRGEAAAIRREVALLTRACWSHDHYFGNVMNQCARGSALVNDFATAETCGQRSLLVVLRHPGVFFVDPSGYLNVPHDLLAFRARALARAGKFAECATAARTVLAVTPGHLELVTGLVPDLARAGRTKDADELFERAWAAHEKALKDFPDGPAARHALAVLAGHCNRKLDDGLKHARAALAFDPALPAYREALAEVHFRRGARPDALKLMEALAAEHPRSALYRRQLSRYESSPFDAPWPHTNE